MFISLALTLEDAIEVSKLVCFTPWTGSEELRADPGKWCAREVAAELAPPPRLPSLLS